MGLLAADQRGLHESEKTFRSLFFLFFNLIRVYLRKSAAGHRSLPAGN